MRYPRRAPSRDEAGASAVEYGLLLAGIAALVVVVIFAFGNSVNAIFGNSCSTLAASITSHSCS